VDPSPQRLNDPLVGAVDDHLGESTVHQGQLGRDTTAVDIEDDRNVQVTKREPDGVVLRGADRMPEPSMHSPPDTS
jgi:hypothetical protein